MIKNRSGILLIIGIVLVCLLVFLKVSESENRIVYVDNVKLFEGFNMTKEMKRIGEKEFNVRKTSLDSLYTKLQSEVISEGEKKVFMQQFIQKKEELEHFNQVFASEETSKIWLRIQAYTTEFSKENEYQLIIGSQKGQSVLFADENIDVTEELLAYINKKYEGFK